MNKVIASAEDAIRDIPDGATIMIGGFGLCGIPENLIRALVHKGTKGLTTISNNVGVDGYGMGLLLAAGQIRRHIGSYVGENRLLEQMVLEKTIRDFDGRMYVMEHALKADFAFVKAWKGDKWGNLVYRKTARNFNPMMATAAKVTIAEVEHLVEVGELDPDLVHTPGIYVKRIFQGEAYEKRIEKKTVRKS